MLTIGSMIVSGRSWGAIIARSARCRQVLVHSPRIITGTSMNSDNIQVVLVNLRILATSARLPER